MNAEPKPLILLVDDFEDAREIYTTYLEYRGRRVISAESGPQAIEAARQHRPDIILLDLRMPGMTGTETMLRLRSDLTVKQVPIVALTAHALENERIAALRAGFDAVITKPVLPDDLCQAIDDILAGWQPTV